MNSDVLILEGARTPFCAWGSGVDGKGEKGGKLKDLDPFDLGAVALKGAIARAGVSPDFVVFSNMYPVGPHGCYGARYVSHRAGLPVEVPGTSVGIACGSGLLAVATAAENIRRGDAKICAAVGADSVTKTPKSIFVPSFVDASCAKHIGLTVQERADEKRVGRQAQDAWALRSHREAARAARAGLWAEEIVATAGVSADDAVLAEPRAEHFANARILLDQGSKTITHSTVHAIVDGGAALILADAKAAKGPALGRFVSWATAGVHPEQMAYASVPAVKLALEKARWRVKDVDLWEVNETFAAQVLLDRAALGLDEEKVNPNGGAIALGHPFAATGPRLVHTLLLELRRRHLRRGVASISIGAGLGIAVCVEAL